MPEYLKQWFEELNRRWISGEQLSLDDQRRLTYLRSTYINEIRAEAMKKGARVAPSFSRNSR